MTESARRDQRYRTQRDYWRDRFYDLAAGVVAGGNLGLLELLDDEAETKEVRDRALRLLDVRDVSGTHRGPVGHDVQS